MSEDQALAQIRRVLEGGADDPAHLMSEVTRVALMYQYARTRRWAWGVSGGRVLRGPLSGMRYLPAAVETLLPCKVIGTYETELHATVERVVGGGYSRLVNVGCAEGYYAVGLALLMPRLRVFAFDTDPRARELCLNLARLNGVAERVTVAGACDHTLLRELALPQTLVLCDIEGGETDLLDPSRVPGLVDCHLLVECHDFMGRPISDDLAERFRPTHDVELIPNTWNNPNAVPFLRGLPPLLKFLAVWEGRPGLTPWLFLTSRRTALNEGIR